MDVTIVFSFSLSRNKLLEEKNDMSIDSVLENAKRYFALRIMQSTEILWIPIFRMDGKFSLNFI